MARLRIKKPLDPVQEEADLRAQGFEITRVEEMPDEWAFYFTVRRVTVGRITVVGDKE